MLPAGPEKAEAGRGRQQLAAAARAFGRAGVKVLLLAPCASPRVTKAGGVVTLPLSHASLHPEAAHDLQEAKVAPAPPPSP